MVGLATFFGEVEIEVGNKINSLFHAENMHQGYPWTVFRFVFFKPKSGAAGPPSNFMCKYKKSIVVHKDQIGPIIF
jgi:hypothetical protein